MRVECEGVCVRAGKRKPSVLAAASPRLGGGLGQAAGQGCSSHWTGNGLLLQKN